MLEQFTAIVRNTFFESIRQPIVLVILTIAIILLILANPLSAYTMDDDQRMLIDMGLATIFVAGALLAAFVATGVLTREIENKTALTVISKPVGRPMFVIGKFIGVAGALVIAVILMGFTFMLVELHSVLQTVRDPIHLPVITFGVGGAVIALAAATWCNYFYGKVFASTVICFLTPVLALAYLMSLLFAHDFTPQPISRQFKPDLWLAIIATGTAILVLTAIAIAASARLGQLLTLVVTIGLLLMGLLSDHLVGRQIHAIDEVWLSRAKIQGLTHEEERIREFTMNTGEVRRSPNPEMIDVPDVPLSDMAQGRERATRTAWTVAHTVIPNFQVMFLSDAVTQQHVIPRDYLGLSVLYGSLHMVAALGIGVALFQNREVG